MSAPLTLLAGAALGMAVGSILVPLTRRELAASVGRAMATDEPAPLVDGSVPRINGWQRIALAGISGLLPAWVLYRVGWSFNAVPPLLLLVGLVQLAYCDLTERLLPKTLVYALSTAVAGSAVLVAAFSGDWHRLLVATLGGLASFALFFFVNLMNPRWMAFGDVRLSLVFGFGLAWVSPIALFQAFLYANVLAVVVGLILIATHRAQRSSAVPFGLFMALGAALVLLHWS
jgi:prepilin signal peptidase PulO-like enzyme (type II secretory pathway)